MGNMRFKVGDRVRIKSLDWYNENKNNKGIIVCGSESFTHPMSYFCNKVVNIITIQDDCYRILEDDGDWYWTDEMIEGLVEEEVFIKANDIYNEEYSKGEYCHEQSFKWGFQEGYNYSHKNDKLEISLKEDYQFIDENGNVINTNKIVLEKKKKEYPKTYEECCKIFGLNHYLGLSWNSYDEYSGVITGLPKRIDDIAKKLESLSKLIICRDAYWKIAGEEVGLGRPWSPRWDDGYQKKWIINFYKDEINLTDSINVHFVLAFPTEEMRDAFKENFDSDIEFCKELL